MSATSAPTATTARVIQAAAPRFDVGDPLVVLYGSGVSDTFVCTDYQERQLDEVLWHLLRERGIRRIVFSSATEPVYFLDRESFEVSGGRSGPAAAEMTPSQLTGHQSGAASAGMRHFTGPQGTRAVRVGPAPPQAGAAAPAAGRMGAAHAVKLLDGYMRQSEIPTAVVVIRAEHFLQVVGTSPDVAESFAEWAYAGSVNDNVCVLAFTSRGWDGVVDFVRSLGRMNTLVSFLEHQGDRRVARGVGELGEPDAAEIERLVHLARLRHGLRLADWGELERITAALAAQPSVLAVTWLRRLRGLAREGVPLSERVLRERGWVESLPDGRGAWERLRELTGLAEVKEHIDRLRWLALAEAARRERGLLGEPTSLHLVFTGNPGTGKTTVARLVGELFREMGLLRRGHVHAPEASELVGMYVGHTAVQTNQAIDRALDGVLFIDEAYRLSEQPGGFGREAIDTLITRMDNDRDRLVVIAAGYPDQMDAFLGSNPGLPRRFPRGNVIRFPDYEPEALFTILISMLRSRGLSWVPQIEESLRRVTAGMYAARDATFGNAGEMRNLAQELETNWARRVRAVVTEPVTAEDIPASYRRYL